MRVELPYPVLTDNKKLNAIRRVNAPLALVSRYVNRNHYSEA